MSQKRIFILNGHPAAQSLNRSMAETYAAAARASGFDVRISHLHDLQFDPDFEYAGYSKHKPHEADLENVLSNIEWCNHFVVVSPMWWGGLPAKLKGLFDRAFLPGRTFNTRETDMFGKPTPMLTGRTGRMIMTADTPKFILNLMYRQAIVRQLRDQILGFIGIKPAKLSYFAGASHPKEGAVAKWLAEVESIGAKGA